MEANNADTIKDLLAALRDMLDATTDEYADALSLRIAQTNARAAIAKAEGGRP